MTKGAMLEAGMKMDEFDIVPFPIDYPDLLFNYVPDNAKHYMTIYDEWGDEKYYFFKKLNYDVEVMWKRPIEEKVVSGSQIRNYITKGEPWSHLVPKTVFDYVLSHDLDKRVRELVLNDENK
jgi:hypothetical protein